MSPKTLLSQARRGHVEAQFALGKYYDALVTESGGDPWLRHLKMALNWFRKAAEKGHAKAQHQLGQIYAWRFSKLHDFDAALFWLNKAIEQGDSDAAISLGRALKDRDDVTGAIRCWEQAIAMGNTEGFYCLGHTYLDGEGVERNKDKAIALFRQAAELGNVHAQTSLGWALNDARGMLPPPATLSESLHWFTVAADRGDAYAQYTLGSISRRGYEELRDIKRAVRYLRLSGAQGYIYAQLELGYMYRDGDGVRRNYAMALRWFQKAASHRYYSNDDILISSANNCIGEMYLRGQGVPVDYSTAFQYFLKAAKERWCSEAHLNLGIMYFEGKGIPQNFIEAKRCFLKARRYSGNAAPKWLKHLKAIRLRPPTAAVIRRLQEREKNQLQLKLFGSGV
jgi:TPR repeat protein